MSAPKATSSIGKKILIRSMIVAIVPLLLLGGAVAWGVSSLRSNASDKVAESRELLSSGTIEVTSQGQADRVAQQINLVLVERIKDVLGWARAAEIVDGARAANEFSTAQELEKQPIEELEQKYSQIRSTGVAFKSKVYLTGEVTENTYFEEILVTDKFGFNAALTNASSDFVQSDEDWWQEAWNDGLSISDVEFDEVAEVYSVDIAARVGSAAGGQQGVIKATLNIAFVSAIADANSSEQLDYIVSLADGRLIAETATAHQSDRLMNPEIVPAEVSKGLADAIETKEPKADASGSETVWAHASTKIPSVYENIENFDGFDWIVVSTQSTESAFAPIEGIEQLDGDINQSGNNLLAITLGVLLLAGLVAFFSARFLAESIVVPIRRLTSAASDAATSGLPSAVAEINTEGADPDSIEAPQVSINTNDELEELAGSFNLVQDSAVRLAAQQAVSRRNTSEMFVNLGRRNQSLLKRQLRFIDGLEKSETDPDTLESLFKLDHLATRMRRNAESLLVLAGDRTPRRWAKPVAVDQALQAALAEVENYERVDISGLEEGQVQGNVVADVAHILAELVENALNFSPPQSEVTVTGQKGDDGYTITITDEGMGMSKEEIIDANEGLAEVHELSDVPSRCLGLFVVGRLARRHGMNVKLASSPTGSGLQSIVTLPSEITDAAQETTKDAGSVSDVLDVSSADAEAEALARLAEAELALAEVQQAKQDDASDESDDSESVAQSDADATTSTGDDAESSESTDGGSAESDSASASDSEAESAESDKPDTTEKPVGEPKVETEPASTPSKEFGRRVEDEAPAIVDGKEFPRRKSNNANKKKRKSKGAAAVGAAAAVTSAATAKPKTTDESGDSGESKETSTEARRADDEPSKSNDPAPAGEMTELGFARRSSKKSKGSTTEKTTPKKAASTSSGDVMQDAEQSRNRWSQFQRGKEDAEGEITQS